MNISDKTPLDSNQEKCLDGNEDYGNVFPVLYLRNSRNPAINSSIINIR